MIVIKIGGGKSINLEAIIDDLKTINEPFVIVHGGNYMLDTVLEKFGVKKKYYTSPNGQISRATNKDVLDAIYMAYSGYMNKSIITACQKISINAIGLSGVDGKLLEGKRHEAILTVENGKKKVIRDDLTGTVEQVNTKLLNLLLSNGFIPVITLPTMSVDGEAINTDGDKIAAKIAAVLQATTLLFLIETAGFLTDFPNEKSLVTAIKKTEIDSFLPNAKGRMKKKLQVSKWALEQGVKTVSIADGRMEQPITNALYNKKGTIIT